MEGKIDIINEFETKPDHYYHYTRIAGTKGNKIIFFKAKEKDQAHKTRSSNETYMVARCSPEDMTTIIKKKIKFGQYYTSDKEVYIYIYI